MRTPRALLLTVTALQRFGGGLNLNVHFHTLALDGAFVRSPAGRLLRRRGLEPETDGTGRTDPVAVASLALAGIVGASVQGRVALGARAGAPVRRLSEGLRQACGGTTIPLTARMATTTDAGLLGHGGELGGGSATSWALLCARAPPHQ